MHLLVRGLIPITKRGNKMKTLTLEEQRAIYAASTELDENGNKIYAKPVKVVKDTSTDYGYTGQGFAVHSASTR